MDGINGITVLYAASVLISLCYFNMLFVFTNPNIILTVATATLIFGIFNCRKKAVCFAGDVGSVSISFILIYFILSLIIFTENPIFVLLFAVYGVDSIMTIVYRLSKKENIFKAHRSHLYQLMANERKMPHLLVSGIYFVVQMVVNIILIAIMGLSFPTQCLIGVGVIVLLAAIYWIVRYILVEKVRVAL
jgi:UDP-N-acetylmuramyl pentapeptide phosphotransferase/UDP-N-acetylglucosamine-1-phosphate transferase